MTIQIGDQLPDATFKIMTADGPGEVSTSDIFAGKKVVLFAVPGAFTPTCHNNHLSGFLENLSALKSKGIDTVAVTAVNDVFVMDAWAKATGAEGKIVFLADGSADFAKDIGLELDASLAGLGMRSQRYSMIVEDGKVTSLNVEDTPGQAAISGAAGILNQL
ncbi:peroxiredoxin [Breoghania sp.]|uniref:peroxiredoxin n=1 Tax=Breoghania sp. TaxID=2065378 RepID=UPI002637B333|nr:peroxiredoxin [Breoghania sp.]MDJ0930271.1 peroxiredoxin [Breoghania sp.]